MENSSFTREEWEKSRKFRKKLAIWSRILAFLLIIAIFWIGFVQVKYAKEFNDLKSEYGPHAYCYMCGLESIKRCDCIYKSDDEWKLIDVGNFKQELAEDNALKCIERVSLGGNYANLSLLNVSF
jgi:hypothetical protein